MRKLTPQQSFVLEEDFFSLFCESEYILDLEGEVEEGIFHCQSEDRQGRKEAMRKDSKKDRKRKGRNDPLLFLSSSLLFS